MTYTPCHRCREDNWDGVIDPVTVIVYDTNDYSVPYGVITLDYPDTTYELTGLDECTVDIVFQGDDIVSRKMAELVITADSAVVPDKTLNILYDMDPAVLDDMVESDFLLRLKGDYDNPESAHQILVEEYGCYDLKAYNWVQAGRYFYSCSVSLTSINSALMTQKLNNDWRVLYAEPKVLGTTTGKP